MRLARILRHSSSRTAQLRTSSSITRISGSRSYATMFFITRYVFTSLLKTVLTQSQNREEVTGFGEHHVVINILRDALFDFRWHQILWCQVQPLLQPSISQSPCTHLYSGRFSGSCYSVITHDENSHRSSFWLMNGVLESARRLLFAVGPTWRLLILTICVLSSGVTWNQWWRWTSESRCSRPWCKLHHLYFYIC